ncbi:MAG: glycosyltransferase family 9 protein, partial [Acidobacteriota bacterium]|nr:glycosyltransferase family 9 protein [Acidobacteriota bacterium]
MRPPLDIHGTPSQIPPAPEPGTVRRILWVRTDAIGDAVLAMDQLRGIAARYPSAEIHIACQGLTSSLYSACPFQLAVHPFDRRSFRKHAGYRRDYLRLIKDLGVDLAVNGLFSRETMTDAITLASRAPIRVSWRGDDSQAKASRLRFLDGFYTHQLDGASAPALEIHRNQQFLEFIGCGLVDYQPRIWISEA